MTKSEIVLFEKLETLKNVDDIYSIDCDNGVNQVTYSITDYRGIEYTMTIPKDEQDRFSFNALTVNLLMVKVGLPSDVVNSNICFTNADTIRAMNMLMNWIDQTVDLDDSDRWQFENRYKEESPDSQTGLREGTELKED